MGDLKPKFDNNRANCKLNNNYSYFAKNTPGLPKQ